MVIKEFYVLKLCNKHFVVQHDFLAKPSVFCLVMLHSYILTWLCHIFYIFLHIIKSSWNSTRQNSFTKSHRFDDSIITLPCCDDIAKIMTVDNFPLLLLFCFVLTLGSWLILYYFFNPKFWRILSFWTRFTDKSAPGNVIRKF